MKELLLDILCCALWGKAYDGSFTERQLKDILRLAEEQTVFGLVFEAIQQVEIKGVAGKWSEDISEIQLAIFDAVGLKEQIKQQNVIVNKELADFARICRMNGQEPIVVKGQTIGSLYPNALLRQSGDIDFLVHGEGFTVHDYAEALGVVIPKMSEHEVGFDRNDVRYELHTRLRGWAKKRHQRIWDKLMAQEWALMEDDGGKKWSDVACYVDIEGEPLRTLSPTMNAAYVFIHLFFHFIREGVSLRQFCDWAMVLHHYRNDIHRERLRVILTDLDLMDAYCAFGTILTENLGLPAEVFPFAIDDKHRIWHDKILKDIFRGGNFGFLHHQAEGKWKYKMETMTVAIRNSFRYFRLCPSEVGGMLPRLVKWNVKILLSSQSAVNG